MFRKLIEASKLELKKGIYELSYDEKNNVVKVLDRRTGQLNYVVKSENDNMLLATIIYFGIRNKELESAKAY
jgi:hypothetical protein